MLFENQVNEELYRTAVQNLRNVISLAGSHFSSSSDEVQYELESLYNAICQMKYIHETDRNRVMLEIGNEIVSSHSSKDELNSVSMFMYSAFMLFFSKCRDGKVKTA